MLTRQQNVDEEIAKAVADAVGNRIKSANIRDSVKIGRIARSIEDVNFLVDTFSNQNKVQPQKVFVI